jgi:hypothetical protein
MRALLRVDEVDNIMSLMIFLEFESGALHELEQVRGLINVFGSFNDRNRLAPLLVVVLLLCSRQLPTAYSAGVLAMLRATPLRRHERPRGLPWVEIASETALPHKAVDSGRVAVALPLVPIEVVPAREVVVAEAAGEPGAWSPPHVPLRQS